MGSVWDKNTWASYFQDRGWQGSINSFRKARLITLHVLKTTIKQSPAIGRPFRLKQMSCVWFMTVLWCKQIFLLWFAQWKLIYIDLCLSVDIMLCCFLAHRQDRSDLIGIKNSFYISVPPISYTALAVSDGLIIWKALVLNKVILSKIETAQYTIPKEMNKIMERSE